MTARMDERLRVLLVEDHPILRDIMVEYLERMPMIDRCTFAVDAEAALEQLQSVTPDLMLIDLSLPGMDGIELIKELRKRYPDLPCAILSGHRSQVYVTKAFAAGANGYLLKGDALEVERGIRMMQAGNRYLSDELRIRR